MRCFSRWAAALLVALAGVATPVWSQSAPELSKVPANAALVVHFQAGTIYASPDMKVLREFLSKAGPSAMKVFEERFQPGPQQLDRITGIMMAPDLAAQNKEPVFGFIVTTLADVSADNLPERLGIPMVTVARAPFPCWAELDGTMALAVPESRMIVIGSRDFVKQLSLAPKGGKVPEAFEGLDKFHFALVANMKSLPAQLSEFLPPPLGTLAKANTIRATVMLNQQAKIDLQLNFPSEKDAVLAEDAVRDLARRGLVELEKPRRHMQELLIKPEKSRPSTYAELPDALTGLLGLGALNQVEEILKNPPVKRQGANLAAEITTPPGIPPVLLAAGLFGTSASVPAVGQARVAAQRAQASNHFKQIGLAYHLHHDAVGHFPTDIIDKKTGKPLLSWRVAILPYIEQQALYQQFKLDQPWDSEHNLKLAKNLVKVYQIPNQKDAVDAQGNGLTHMMVFTGKGSLFPAGKKPKIVEIPDGSSNTILCVESKVPGIWSKPGDLPFDVEKDFPAIDSIVGLTPNGFHALFCDGSVRWIKSSIDRNTMKLLIRPDDGTPIGDVP